MKAARKSEGPVAVTLSIANHHASLPIAYRLYLPKTRAEGAERPQDDHLQDQATDRAEWTAGAHAAL
jgi:SRSO17 transposase